MYGINDYSEGLDIQALREAIEILIEHAQEQYPHFEGSRGKRDIKRVENVLNLFEGDSE